MFYNIYIYKYIIIYFLKDFIWFQLNRKKIEKKILISFKQKKIYINYIKSVPPLGIIIHSLTTTKNRTLPQFRN